jgi:predicted small lipoprotein YifL
MDYTPAMKKARSALLVLALALALPGLAGCGNKGPLVHPDAAADQAGDASG